MNLRIKYKNHINFLNEIFGIDDCLKRSRVSHLVYCRSILFNFINDYDNVSSTKIAKELGGFDHSNIIAIFRKKTYLNSKYTDLNEAILNKFKDISGIRHDSLYDEIIDILKNEEFNEEKLRNIYVFIKSCR